MNKKGFTLIEMLVVIAIIAILAAIVIPTASTATVKAKEAADVANLRSWVAEYTINKMDDADYEWADVFDGDKINYAASESDTHGYSFDDTTAVVSYNAVAMDEEFEWTLADELLEIS